MTDHATTIATGLVGADREGIMGPLPTFRRTEDLRAHRRMRRRRPTVAVRVGLATALLALVSTTGASAAVRHDHKVDTVTAPSTDCSFLFDTCKLSVGLDDAEVIDPVLAPDGERVVIIKKSVETLRVDLYSVAVTGGFPVKLSASTGKSARFVAISPDSTRVLYTLPAGTGQPGDPVRRELFSVPIVGPSSAGVRLAADINTATRVRVSPDGRKVVFAPPAGDRLRVVPLSGPASASGRLTDPFVAGGTVDEVRVSADSSSVVYRADQNTDGTSELYRVPLTLSPAPDPPTAKLNGPLVAGGDVGEFTLAPDNGPVVYLADQDTDEVTELYRVRLGGSERAKLSRTLPFDWDVRPPGEDDLPARVLPDGSRVIYRIAHQDSFPPYRLFAELYSVPIAGPGSAGVRLDHPPLLPPGHMRALESKISADSSRVVYEMVDQSLPGEGHGTRIWLLSVPAAGPANAGRVLAGPSEFIYTLSPDSRRVAYLDLAAPNRLFSVPIAGGTSVRLNGAENPGAFLRINAGGDRIVYEATAEDGRPQLFSAALDGGGARYDLTAGLDAADVRGETLTPTGTRVVYTVRRGGLYELFSSRLTPRIVPPTQ
jgi:Tol biopolymer transport system component